LREDEADPAVIAAHIAEVDVIGETWALDALAAAAREALAHGDPATAVARLRRGLAEPGRPRERARLLRDLGLAEQRLGNRAAIGHLQQAFALSDHAVGRAEILRALLLGPLTEGRGDDVRHMLDTILPDLAARDPDRAERVEAEVLSAARHTLTPSLWVAERLRSWRGRASPERPGGRLLLANLATLCALDGGSAAETAHLAALALADGRLHTDQTAYSMPIYQAIWQLTATEELDRAERALSQALADARQRGSVVGFALASLFHSYLELARGAVPAAETHALAALEAARQLPRDWFALPAIAAALLDVFVEQNRREEGEGLLGERGWTADLPDSVPYRLLLHSRDWLRLAGGRAREAAADFCEHLRREGRLQALSTHLVPSHSGAALTFVAAGAVDRARPHAAQSLAEAHAWGAPRGVARALRVRAKLEPPPVAAATLTEALRLLTGSPARLDEAWTRFELGAMLIRLGRRADGGQELRSALDLAHRGGGRAAAATAHAELIAAGYRPRRAAATGLDALTGSERQVVELAARNLTNREIAQVLFVTERTVELHLTSAYRKLGVTSRRELGHALGKVSAR
jgi:DNA-binding CsgD family transcriptional regulator